MRKEAFFNYIYHFVLYNSVHYKMILSYYIIRWYLVFNILTLIKSSSTEALMQDFMRGRHMQNTLEYKMTLQIWVERIFLYSCSEYVYKLALVLPLAWS